MHARVFLETVIPLLGMVLASLIMLSTVLNEENFFSKIIVLRDKHGDPLFDIVQIGLVCDECLKKESLAEQLRCDHMKDSLPPWKSSARNERFNNMFIATGNTATALRENAGVVASDITPLFKRKQLEDLFINTKPPRLVDLDRIRAYVPLLFIVCDPNGGGNSQMTLMSGFINKKNAEHLPINALVVRRLIDLLMHRGEHSRRGSGRYKQGISRGEANGGFDRSRSGISLQDRHAQLAS